MRHIPIELQKSLKQGECVLFAGSGLSEGLPRWKELMEPLKDDLGIKPDENPLYISEYYENEFGRRELEEKIISQLKKDVPLTKTHDRLNEIPFKAIITTNYDSVLERALSRLNKDFVKIIRGREAPKVQTDQLPLVKMHGDLDDPSSMVITKTDYDEYGERHRALITYLLGFLISYNFLFVGFSLKDPNFDNIYAQLKSLFGESRRKSYAIFKNPSKFEVKRLKKMGIEVIAIEDYNEIPEIFEELASICSEKKWEKTELTSEQLQSIQETFCKVVEIQNKWLDPRGIFQFDRMLTRREVELEEVYVAPRLIKQATLRKERAEEAKIGKNKIEREELEEKKDEKLEEKPEEELEEKLEEYLFQREVELTVEDALSSGDNHMVILGEPGVGKTCLLHYVALKGSTSPGKFLGIEKLLLPVLIPLKEYQKFGMNEMLKEFVFHYIGNQICSLPKEILEYFLRKNSFFFLFDGLDEVVSEGQRIEVSRQVERFMAQYPDTRIILTSRPAGYKAASLIGAIPHFEIAEFNEYEINEFLTKWFTFLEKIEEERFEEAKVKKKADELTIVIRNRRRILHLARNPLLLTILVLIHRVGRKLPERRAEFYEYAVRTIAGSWETWKSLQVDKRIPDQETILAILEKIGFRLHVEKQGNAVGNGELKIWLNEAMKEEIGHSSRGEIDDFIWMLNERAGLLVERGLELYGFVHLTFQEYFAARHLACGRGVKLCRNMIKKYLYSSRWREVFLLASAIAPPENADAILDTVLKSENPFERHIHSNLLFAGQMLADIPRVNDLKRKNVINNLISLTASENVDILRIEALDVLIGIGRAFPYGYSSWALRLLHDMQPSFRQKALEFLIAVEADDPEVQDRVFKLFHSDECFDVRQKALEYFITIGANDPEVQDRVLSSLSFASYTRKKALEFFITTGARGSRIRNRILELLRDGDLDVRQEALEYFITVGKSDPEVQDKFIKMLSDESLDICRQALEYFTIIRQESPKVQKEILGLFDNRHPYVRQQALEYFTAIETKDPMVQERIYLLLDDIHPDVRQQALEYSTAIETKDPMVQERIYLLLDDKYPEIRQQALEYFTTIEARDPKVLDKILSLLHDADSDVRRKALEYLIISGARDSRIQDKALEMLDIHYSSRKALEYFTAIKAKDIKIQEKAIDILCHEEIFTRQLALEYFTTIETRDPMVQERIFDMLNDSHPSNRQKALEYFVAIKARDPAIQQKAIDMLKDRYSYVRQTVIEYLIAVGADDPEVQNRMFDTFSDIKPSDCQKALEYFVAIKARDPAIQQKAIDMLKDRYSDAPQKALEYFIAIGAKDPEIQKKVASLLDDWHSDARQKALEFIIAVGADDPEVQKKVASLLDSWDSDVRQKALEYFINIGAKDLVMQKKVMYLLADKDPNVRQKALEYLIISGAKDIEIQRNVISLLGHRSYSAPINEKIQEIAVEYLSRYAREESSRKAPYLFVSSDEFTKEGAYKLMKALLYTEERVPSKKASSRPTNLVE